MIWGACAPLTGFIWTAMAVIFEVQWQSSCFKADFTFLRILHDMSIQSQHLQSLCDTYLFHHLTTAWKSVSRPPEKCCGEVTTSWKHVCYNMHGIGDKIVPSRSSEEKKCCVQDSIHNSKNPEIFISFLLFTVLKEDRFDFMKKWTVRTFKNCVFPLS